MSGTKAPGGPAGMNPPAPSQLRFEILGPQRAWYADRQLDLGPGKQRAVLAVLLLAAGRPVPTGQIVEAVWPDEPPANGPNVVQKYVAGLRRVLEPDRSPRTPGQVLSLTDAGYLLRIAPEAVDAVRFERGIHRARQRHAEGRTEDGRAELTAALELWQGEPFTGFAGPYFETARHRLVELRAVALETRVELELAAGRHRELVGGLVELVAEFPVRERLRHQLMLALYRSGRQAEALAAYRDFGDLLREDYGIEPGEALQELHRRILRSDPTLAPVPDSAADRPSRDGGPGPDRGEIPCPRPVPNTGPGSTPDRRETPSRGPGPDTGPGLAHDRAATPSPGPEPDIGPRPGPGQQRLNPDPAHAVAPPASVAAPPPWPVPAVTSPASPGPVPPVGSPASPWPVPAVAQTSPAPVPHAAPAPYPGPAAHGGFGAGMPPVLPAPPTPAPARSREPLPTWVSTSVMIAGALAVLLTFGLATWLVLLGYAVRRRSWRLGLAAAGYLGSASSLLYLMARGDPDADVPASEAFLGLGLIAVCWLVGAVHVILLNGRVWGVVSGRSVRLRAREAERRVRREQARYLLHHQPAARHQLCIGRPDLPRVFDDGGLVDINAVGEKVIADLPGMTAGQASQVAMDRWVRGPFGSMEELAARCLLPPALTDSLRDLLVFLPPLPPDQS